MFVVMRNNLFFVFAIVCLMVSCSTEQRLYRPGFHIEWKGQVQKPESILEKALHLKGSASCETKQHFHSISTGFSNTRELLNSQNNSTGEIRENASEYIAMQTASSSRDKVEQRLDDLRVVSSIDDEKLRKELQVAPDTLKKPFKPQKQYREIDPVGKYAVITVLAAVALQKIAGMLTWFEVIVPLSFGPGVFIPALVVAFVGVCLSAYSAYRVRKYPEKYKKNEWGKAALAILGWQILMSVLFAWLLGGLPIG